ncbi:MAG: DUF488 domain-containing protein [Chloroflexi bacterium]|nr:DUF488 domain-containing protein [Chloroflexota bacterium]
MKKIFTIGYGNRDIDAFIALLQEYQIDLLVDIRSQPYSGYNKDFTKHQLSELLQSAQIDYRFMGQALGGRPTQEDCYSYSPDRKQRLLDHKKCETKDFYKRGISQLKTCLAKGHRMALMCSELEPERCHRGYVVGHTLDKALISVLHIDKSGRLRPQTEIPEMGFQPSLL